MNTAYLEEFIDFSRDMNYAACAQRVFVSQPSLRAHVHALEEELGVKLVTRRAGKPALTPTGKFFLAKARAIFDVTNTAVHDCQDHARNNFLLNVGYAGSSTFLNVIQTTRSAYQELHPEKSIDINLSSKFAGALSAVYEGEIDILLTIAIRSCNEEHYPPLEVEQVPERVASWPIKSSSLLFWVDASSPLYKLETIRRADLNGLELMLFDCAYMRQAGARAQAYLRERDVHIDVSNRPFASPAEYFFAGTRNTVGIAFSEGIQVQGGIRYFAIEDLSLMLDYTLVYNPSCLGESSDAFFSDLKQRLSVEF